MTTGPGRRSAAGVVVYRWSLIICHWSFAKRFSALAVKDSGRQELRRREGLACEPRQVNGSLEIEHFVDPHSDRAAARPVRSKVHLGRAVLNAVDIVPELLAVIYGGHVVPDTKRMQRFPIQESLALCSRLVIAVEAPLITGDPELKQHPVCRVRARGILLAQMKPPLLRLAAIGPEDGFPCKRLGPRQRVV